MKNFLISAVMLVGPVLLAGAALFVTVQLVIGMDSWGLDPVSDPCGTDEAR